MHQDPTGPSSNPLNPAWDVLRFGNETQSKTTMTFSFLTQIILSQAAMFVDSLIFPSFQNSQFEEI